MKTAYINGAFQVSSNEPKAVMLTSRTAKPASDVPRPKIKNRACPNRREPQKANEQRNNLLELVVKLFISIRQVLVGFSQKGHRRSVDKVHADHSEGMIGFSLLPVATNPVMGKHGNKCRHGISDLHAS